AGHVTPDSAERPDERRHRRNAGQPGQATVEPAEQNLRGAAHGLANPLALLASRFHGDLNSPCRFSGFNDRQQERGNAVAPVVTQTTNGVPEPDQSDPTFEDQNPAPDR